MKQLAQQLQELSKQIEKQTKLKYKLASQMNQVNLKR